MKKFFLIAMILIGLVSVLFINFKRMDLELNNRGVQFILDYDEIEALSKQSDKNLKWWLERFGDLGATSVAIQEETLHSLVEDDKDLKIEVFKNILDKEDWREEYLKEFVNLVDNNEVSHYDVIMTTGSKDIFDFVTLGLEERYGSGSYKFIEENSKYLILIEGEEEEALYLSSRSVVDTNGKNVMSKKELYSSKVATIGLGFDSEKIKIIKDSGLKVIPRPINYSKFSERLVKAFINEVESNDLNPNIILFGGSEILGNREGLDELAKYMNSNNISLSLIESGVQRQHLKQGGMEELSNLVNYNIVRTFTMWDWLRLRYRHYNYQGAEEIENSLYRAITERNIRAIYFKPFMKNSHDYVTEYSEYEKTFNSLNKRLDKHGIEIGQSSNIEYFKVSNLNLLIMGIGLVGGAVLLLAMIFNINNSISIILAALGSLSVMGMLYINRDITQKILALGSSVVFPSLGILYFIRTYKRIISNKWHKLNIKTILAKAISTLIVTSAISLVGGLFIGAILSDVMYLLEIDMFRGVKVSQILPIVIFLLIYIVEFGYDKETKSMMGLVKYKNQILKIFNTDIKVKHILFTSVLLIIGYIYISRTGHESSIQPSDLEMIFRNFLENSLLARPRTKEFLIAFPMLMVGIYIAYRGYKKLLFFFSIGAVIGQTSIANTFSHIRTPINLSIIRTGYSIFFGIVLGIIFIIGFKILDYFFQLIKGAKTNE